MGKRTGAGRSRNGIAALAILGLALAGCGGGDESTVADANGEPSQSPDVVSDDDAVGLAEDTLDLDLPGFEVEPGSFEDVADVEFRFANVYAKNGEPQAVDVYWGTDAESGELITTVPYGEITEFVTVRHQTDAFFVPETDEGETSVAISVYPAGSTERASQLLFDDEPTRPGYRLTWVISWAESFTPGETTASWSVIFEQAEAGALPQAPADKALLVTTLIGVGAIPDGDFLIFDEGNGCIDAQTIDPLGNVAGAVAVDPGIIELRLFDANTQCASGTSPATVEAAVGERYLVIPYGIVKDDRQLLVAPAS